MTTIIPKHLNKSLSVHTFTYFYKCSDKTYYGLFQYLAEKPDCNFKKHRKKKCTKYVTRSFHSLGFNRIEFVVGDMFILYSIILYGAQNTEKRS